MIYTGIGARKTPGNILNAMVQVGEYMYDTGHTLRSGGAQGADRAFEIGADRQYGLHRNEAKGEYVPALKHIYLPWKGFEGNTSPFNNVCEEAMKVAALFHPRWDSLSQGAQKLMGRNAYQMLGLDLNTPSACMICWTLGGMVEGGTGQAIRMALYYDIPVLNFGNLTLPEMNARLEIILEENP